VILIASWVPRFNSYPQKRGSLSSGDTAIIPSPICLQNYPLSRPQNPQMLPISNYSYPSSDNSEILITLTPKSSSAIQSTIASTSSRSSSMNSTHYHVSLVITVGKNIDLSDYLLAANLSILPVLIRDSPTYEKKPCKAHDLPMIYSRMLFLPKNDSFLTNMLPAIEHAVKNKENVKFPGHCLKYGRAYLSP